MTVFKADYLSNDGVIPKGNYYFNVGPDMIEPHKIHVLVAMDSNTIINMFYDCNAFFADWNNVIRISQ